ncbi:hypothetical protein Hanom_Chr10g00891561 [Helianthus anomalus]
MSLNIKNPHNYLTIFEKTSKYTSFHSIINLLTSSKYKSILTTDAPVHTETLRQFWFNAEIESEDNNTVTITSKVRKSVVRISPSTISTTFALDNLGGKTNFDKRELHTEFTERGYDAQLKEVTMYKPNFPPPMKFLFHSLLTCFSAKTTAFNEIPLNIKYLGYAILKKSDYNLSQALFSDLLTNVKM